MRSRAAIARPWAVLELSRKRFDRPVEILASKPHYRATTGFDVASPPEHLETQYVGRTFLMGSLAGGTPPGRSDVNGFKILAEDDEEGAVALQGVAGPDAAYPGSPRYEDGKGARGERGREALPVRGERGGRGHFLERVNPLEVARRAVMLMMDANGRDGLAHPAAGIARNTPKAAMERALAL